MCTCELCRIKPARIRVIDRHTGEKYSYCDGCYFLIHPARLTVTWP